MLEWIIMTITNTLGNNLHLLQNSCHWQQRQIY